MRERDRQKNPGQVTTKIFDIETHLQREKGHDLLDIDPANLSLKERLRQLRQFEKTLIHRLKITSSEEKAKNLTVQFLHSLPESMARDMTVDYVNDLSLEEIGNKYNVKPNTAAKHISFIRLSQLEPNLLFKAGYTRITRNNMPHLAHSNISLRTYRIAGIRYASQKHLKDYHEVKRVVDPSLLEQGFVLLGSIATERDYASIQKDPVFSQRIVKKHKRIYIKPEDLSEYLDQKRNYSRQSRAMYPEDRDKPRNEVMKIRRQRMNNKINNNRQDQQ